MSTRDIRGMILDDRRSATVKSAGHSGNGRGAAYLREIVGSSWPRARSGHPVGRGQNFAHQVDEVVDGCAGNLRWCCGALQSARTGRRLAGQDWGGEHLCHRIEGAVDGGLGDVGEAEVVVAGIGPQPGEGLVQMEAGAF